MSKCVLSATDVVSITDTQNTATLLWDGICLIHRKSQLNPLMFALCICISIPVSDIILRFLFLFQDVIPGCHLVVLLKLSTKLMT